MLFSAVLGLRCCARLSQVAVVRAALPCRARSLVVLASLVPSTGPGHIGFSSCSAGSIVVADGLSCSEACGIFPAQGSNLCPLHWQADSYPLHHQGGPIWSYKQKQRKKP